MADHHLYKITYASGKVKYGNRKVLGCVVGARKQGAYWDSKPVAVGRADMPEFEDVTEEFFPGNDG